MEDHRRHTLCSCSGWFFAVGAIRLYQLHIKDRFCFWLGTAGVSSYVRAARTCLGGVFV